MGERGRKMAKLEKGEKWLRRRKRKRAGGKEGRERARSSRDAEVQKCYRVSSKSSHGHSDVFSIVVLSWPRKSNGIYK